MPANTQNPALLGASPYAIGPFTQEIFNRPAEIAPLKTSGYEGTGTAAAMFASKFIEGLQSSRREQFMRSEEQRMNNLSVAQNAYARIAADPNLAPEAKAEAGRMYDQYMTKLALKDVPKGADKSHPLAGFAKSILEHASGGAAIPKKWDGSPGELLSHFETIRSRPEYDMTAKRGQAQQALSQAIQQVRDESGPSGFHAGLLYQHPVAGPILRNLGALGMDEKQILMGVPPPPANPIEAAQYEAVARSHKQRKAASLAALDESGQVPEAQGPPAPTSFDPKILHPDQPPPYITEELFNPLINKEAGIAPKTLHGPNGEVINPLYVGDSLNGGRYAGYYDPLTHKRLNPIGYSPERPSPVSHTLEDMPGSPSKQLTFYDARGRKVGVGGTVTPTPTFSGTDSAGRPAEIQVLPGGKTQVLGAKPVEKKEHILPPYEEVGPNGELNSVVKRLVTTPEFAAPGGGTAQPPAPRSAPPPVAAPKPIVSPTGISSQSPFAAPAGPPQAAAQPATGAQVVSSHPVVKDFSPAERSDLRDIKEAETLGGQIMAALETKDKAGVPLYERFGKGGLGALLQKGYGMEASALYRLGLPPGEIGDLISNVGRFKALGTGPLMSSIGRGKTIMETVQSHMGEMDKGGVDSYALLHQKMSAIMRSLSQGRQAIYEVHKMSPYGPEGDNPLGLTLKKK